MSKAAVKCDPDLWERVKQEVTAGNKGGKPGQWSARKAQFAATQYQKKGGSYEGAKRKDNHLQQWTDEKWGTKSGKKSGETQERYLPEAVREELSNDEYRRTTAKKRADTRKGKQFSAQPQAIASKTARHRRIDGNETKAELYERARKRRITGRSRMSKAELEKALAV